MCPAVKSFAFTIFVLLFAGIFDVGAQTLDTAILKEIPASKDTVIQPVEKGPSLKEADTIKRKDPKAKRPGGAAIRSAILPGLGQVYNKKAWKVPIVYAALGGTGAYFVYNYTWYKRFRQAYTVAYNIESKNDSTGYNNIYPDIQKVFFKSDKLWSDGLRSNRDQTRRDMDYAALYFVIAWVLNVVDATVDAHLNTFDVSPNLSFQLQPGYSEMARTNGLSLVMKFK